MTDERETADAINERATAWVARIDRFGLDDATHAELEAWLAGDGRRRGAFLRADAAWRMLDRASQLALVPATTLAEQPELIPKSATRRRFLIGAAALAAGLAGVALLPGGNRYRTKVGEIRRLPLPDGSLAAINTQSEVAIAVTETRREVRVEEGEAWFQVKKDAARPFLVAVGDIRVQAVGTAFAVRRRDEGVEVQVTEGVVETWSTRSPNERTRLAAGSKALIAETGAPAQPPVEAPVEIDRSLAWRTGQLIFDGDTLAQAAAEFNRYNERQVVIADPALGQEKLVGRFRTNEPDSFARAVATTLGARISAGDKEIRISRG